jgi:DNA-binding NarL/FixJ family response regulator
MTLVTTNATARRTCRVAICDDSYPLVRLLEIAFEVEDDLEIVGVARNGVEVVGVCSQVRPDVLLLDLAMPLRDGLDALPLVLEASPGTRVIVYTGFASETVVERALAAGASEVVLKGGAPSELARRIRFVHDASASSADLEEER